MKKLEIVYQAAWDYDEALIWMKKSYEKVLSDKDRVIIGCGYHDKNIITLGKNKIKNNLDENIIASNPHVLIRQLDRGGGPTAHEPGQLVLYPIMNLKTFHLEIIDLVNLLEKIMYLFVESFGLKPLIKDLSRGVFLDGKKLGFIGLRIKEGISQHGIAINIFNSLNTFSLIAPCGILGLKVTSIGNHTELKKNAYFYATLLSDLFIKSLL